MDMSNMGGMSMDMGMNMFQTTNIELARDFWIIIGSVLGSIAVLRLLSLYQSRTRLRRLTSGSIRHPTRPTNGFQKVFATMTALSREMSYPQLFISKAWLSWMSPPPLGRSLVLLVYWIIIAYMMAAGTAISDGYFWERIGFRNAWIATMQVPLVYLLASKYSIFGLVVGSGHERLNWLHRWVARTLLLSATVHGFYFYTEWVLADMVELQISMMGPMIRYGFAAWAVLALQFITSLGPLRSLCYELFVAQHAISAVVFLWLLYVHVPSYAQAAIWVSVAALASDRLGRTVLLVRNNFQMSAGRRLGHPARVKISGLQTTVLTIENIDFSWKPGQHIYLWLPGVGPTQTHPYTIAGVNQSTDKEKKTRNNSMHLVVRKHAGFSRRLHRFASQNDAQSKVLTAFVMGPYGHPPASSHYETLVLIAASTGASFTLSMLEGVITTDKKTCVTRVDFLIMAKEADEIAFYVERLQELKSMVGRGSNCMELNVHIAVTGGVTSASSSDLTRLVEDRPSSFASGDYDIEAEKAATKFSAMTDVEADGARQAYNNTRARSSAKINLSTSRPDISSLIREPIEAAGGESLVVVCGGSSLVATVRNCVARLSEERAVHKGTGAQGICLHAEQYGF
ncbi:Ferric/cupric reductase transmembrane component 7 [Colletotrichum viniferum]|nr:Ferric/cupric reductase transmembrane component 7 [Colletotrichum viniferum]